MEIYACPFCDAPMPDKKNPVGSRQRCPLCGNITYVPNVDDIARAAGEKVETEETDIAGETVRYSKSPAMFRNSPLLFILACVLIPVAVGLVILGIWWLVCKNIVLTVTDRRLQVKTGLLSKNTNDVWLKDVRNVVVNQTFFQRLFNVGKLEISTSGQSGFEVIVQGIVDPQTVAEMIREGHA